MRIGVFSDVHANLEALTAVLDLFRQEGVQWLLCCGDVVGYGPDPGACIELLRSRRAKVVAGNHDWGVAGISCICGFAEHAKAAVHWTRSRLTPDQLAYLRNLPLREHAGPFQFVHASPSDPALWNYIFTLEDAAAEMGAFVADICFIGHTHVPLVVERISGGKSHTISPTRFELRPDARYLINVGSVGQPRDHDPRACCLVIDWEKRQAEFHRLEYNLTATQEKIAAAGLPEFLASRLSSGI